MRPDSSSTDPPRRFVIALAMRGHRPPPDPLTLGADALRAALTLHGRPGPHRRLCTTSLTGLIATTFAGACAERGGWGEEIVAGPSCVYALVTVPPSRVQNLCDVVRLRVGRRARRELRWPAGERVFTLRPSVFDAGEGDVLATVRAVLADIGTA